MNNFTFKKHSFDMKIADEIYSVNYNVITSGAAKKAGEELKHIADDLRKDSDTAGACKRLEAQIDILLGAGSSKKIFAGRENEIYDHLDVFYYIINEIGIQSV